MADFSSDASIAEYLRNREEQMAAAPRVVAPSPPPDIDIPDRSLPEMPAEWHPPMVGGPPPVDPVSNQVKQAITAKYGFGRGLDTAALKSAQANQNEANLGAGLAEAGNDIGYALARHPGEANNKFYDQQRAQAALPVQNIKDLRKSTAEDQSQAITMAENDPNSPVSKSLQQAYKPALSRLGFDANLIDKVSAADLKGNFQHVIETMTKIKASEDTKRQHDEVMAQLGMSRIAAGSGKAGDKRFSDLGNALDPMKGRAGEFGRQQQIVNNADRVLTVAAQYPDLDKMPKAQMIEVAVASAALVSGGNAPAQATIEHFVPHDLAASEAGLIQFITSNPTGANQKGFIKQMVETAKRERDLAAGKVKNTQLSRVGDFEDLEGKDKKRFEQALRSKGIDPSEYQTFKSGGANPGHSVPSSILDPHPQDSEAIDYAKKHPEDPRSKDILKLNGVR